MLDDGRDDPSDPYRFPWPLVTEVSFGQLLSKAEQARVLYANDPCEPQPPRALTGWLDGRLLRSSLNEMLWWGQGATLVHARAPRQLHAHQRRAASRRRPQRSQPRPAAAHAAARPAGQVRADVRWRGGGGAAWQHVSHQACHCWILLLPACLETLRPFRPTV